MSSQRLNDWRHRRTSRRRAGRSAREAYNAQRKAWLRDNWLLFVGIALLFIVLSAGFHLLMAVWPGDQTWLSGAFTGALAASIYAFTQAPPTAIERWQEGAVGEELTASELAKLDREKWIVLHDLRNGKYNFDHVVIGPGGVFILNSKKSSSRLQVIEGGRRIRLQNRYDDNVVTTDDRMLPQAKRDAVDLNRLIERRTGQRVWVQPVLVWWGPYEEGRGLADGVGIAHGRRLLEYLEQQPPRRLADVAAVIAAVRPDRHRKRRVP